ncbi:hypothetical protein REPUB_Repub07fG0104300 [Reevesia pubescens]
MKREIVSMDDLISEFGTAMNKGFVLDWRTMRDCGACEASKGFCGYDNTANEFLCFCNDGKIRKDQCLAYSDYNEQFLECNQTFNCGAIQGIRYPFWGGVRPRYCGHEGFELICEENQFPVININAQRFHVLNMSQPGMMRIAPVDIWEDPCPEQFHNISLNHNLFDFAATFRNLSIFYGCPLENEIPSGNRFTCTTSSSNSYAYYLDESLLRIHRSELTDCNISITIPVNQSEFDELWSGNENITYAWNKGFDVTYHKDIIPCMACRNSGGVCGSENTLLEFLCFCRDQPYPQFCLTSGTHASSFNIFLIFLFKNFSLLYLVDHLEMHT